MDNWYTEKDALNIFWQTQYKEVRLSSLEMDILILLLFWNASNLNK